MYTIKIQITVARALFLVLRMEIKKTDALNFTDLYDYTLATC